MQVNPATAVQSTLAGLAGPSSTKAPTLDYDAFLKLLIAQLKNQDPTKPTDSTEFVSQLASFSSVEQGIQTNAKLDAILTSSALSQASDLVGRTVTSTDGKTTGEVASVDVAQGKLTAVLKDGTRLSLTDGVTIS